MKSMIETNRTASTAVICYGIGFINQVSTEASTELVEIKLSQVLISACHEPSNSCLTVSSKKYAHVN